MPRGRAPRRLSAAQITRLSRLAGSCLTELCADLTGILRTDPAIGLRQVSEVSSTGLFQDLGSNFLVYQFELKGNTAWLIWESAPAVAVVETVEPDRSWVWFVIGAATAGAAFLAGALF